MKCSRSRSKTFLRLAFAVLFSLPVALAIEGPYPIKVGFSLSDILPPAFSLFLESELEGLVLRGFLAHTGKTQESFVGFVMAPAPPSPPRKFSILGGLGYAYNLGPTRHGNRYVLFVSEIDYPVSERLSLFLTGQIFSPTTCCSLPFHWVGFGIRFPVQ